jgi:hypothetical protein
LLHQLLTDVSNQLSEGVLDNKRIYSGRGVEDDGMISPGHKNQELAAERIESTTALQECLRLRLTVDQLPARILPAVGRR